MTQVEDPEIIAISTVYTAIKDLPADGQYRVLDFVKRKIKGEGSAQESDRQEYARDKRPEENGGSRHDDMSGRDDLGGINEIALKWMRRNNLSSHQLGAIFSLGVDDIELVAKKIPGTSKKERMRNILLLTGVASYLSGGVARIVFSSYKQTCVHYDAFDTTNAYKHMKSFSTDVSGDPKSGYTLTARGMTEATELVKSMIGA